MEKLILLILALISTVNTVFCQIRAKVDERFELTSIAFMLAEAPEYNQCGIRSYKQDIQNQFEKYKSDKSIKYMRELRLMESVIMP